MRIEDDVKLDYKDVLFKPKRSKLESRRDVDLTRTIKFHNSGNEWTGIPIIASNMDGVGTFSMAKELQNADMIMNVMNRSHGDSLIGIVKHYGNLEKTVGVSITSIDTEGFDCMVNLSDGSNSFTRIIFTELAFTP